MTPKQHFELQQRMEFGINLTMMIASVFQQAYFLHLGGTSRTAILIDYDIQAAGSTQDETVTRCARSAIKAACSAAEKHVPFHVAFDYLMQRVHKRIDKHMQQPEPKHALDTHKQA